MLPFILYRLPFEKHATKLNISSVKQYGKIEQFDDQPGFIMAPFNLNDAPTLLFRFDSQEHFGIEESCCGKADHTPVCPNAAPSDDYSAAFDAFSRALKDGDFAKLVLSRHKETPFDTSIESLKKAFVKACNMYPRMMIYLVCIDEDDAWMGCTPEILLAGSANHYRTMALAGTMSVSRSTPVKEIEWNEKNRKEQELVADYVRETIKPFASVIEEEGPYTSRAGELVHLKTEFHFTPNEKFSVCKVADALHPTPAVCGIPTKEAMDFIIKNEKHDRKYYSGVVGIIDNHGETNLFVNLRCAHFTSGTCRAYAGGGLLSSSTMQSEWEETENKMNTILQCIS